MKRTARAHMPQVAILLEASHGISRAMLQGILKYVRAYGPWSLSSAADGTRDLRIPDLRHWQGSGIIARVTTDKIARAIQASGLPAVLINPDDKYVAASHPLAACSRTRSDSRAIGRLAAEHYLSKAFAHFAFVAEPSGLKWSSERRDAFAGRLAEARRPCHLYPCPRPPPADWERERAAMCEWLAALPKPVAIFAANDRRARHVLDACLVTGIAVPYEAAVLGVNNDVWVCETCIPPLSSIMLDAEKAGYEAARMLDNLMRGSGRRRPELFTYGPTGILPRASTETRQVTDRLVIQALEFIRINGGLTIRVSDVAERLGVTPRWAELRFRQTLGQSISDIIRQTRMETVRAMLAETDLPLCAISKKCGFAHPNHLCSIFRRQFGTTMSDYRRSLRNAAQSPP